jgi:hypothetical protein
MEPVLISKTKFGIYYELFEYSFGFQIYQTVCHDDGSFTSLLLHTEYGTFTLEYYQRIFAEYE